MADFEYMRRMRHARPLALTLVTCILASPAWAHHKQTADVLGLTISGDTPLPRVPSQGPRTIALAVPAAGGRQIVTINPFYTPNLQTPLGAPGDNANPAIDFSGKRVVWDAAAMPGRQLIMHDRHTTGQLTTDPTGTATNPAADAVYVAFESTGDLAGTGNPGARQIFVRSKDGTFQQASMGVGTSRNPVVSAKRRVLAFESTSHPVSGADTGISQIWLGSVRGGSAAPVTGGAGPSRNPALSNDGLLLVFESTADLAGTGAETGVSQIFAYHARSQTYARITNDAGGCTLPSAGKIKRDWSIAFVCGGEPYFYMLRADQRYVVQTGGGVTQRVIPGLGVHFLVLSTTANLLGAGTTPGSQVYMINLFKRPAEPVPGVATWFPSRGVPPL